jgi:hypothetical protein
MKFTGAPGNVTGTHRSARLPRLHFRFVGRYIPVTDASIPAEPTTPRGRSPPRHPGQCRHDDDRRLCGEARGVLVRHGNEVSHAQWINQETLGVTDRKASGSISYRSRHGRQQGLFRTIRAVTTQALVLTHGIVAGKIITIGAPKMVLTRHRAVRLQQFPRVSLGHVRFRAERWQ